jgi:hypothetical protein
VEGVWQYKIRLRDAARPGGVEGGVQQFTCTPATSHGFVRVSPTDGRFFEFSDGTPFVHSLVSGEDNMFANRDAWETQMAKFNQAGVRFFRFWLQVWGSNFLFPLGGKGPVRGVLPQRPQIDPEAVDHRGPERGRRDRPVVHPHGPQQPVRPPGPLGKAR